MFCTFFCRQMSWRVKIKLQVFTARLVVSAREKMLELRSQRRVNGKRQKVYVCVCIHGWAKDEGWIVQKMQLEEGIRQTGTRKLPCVRPPGFPLTAHWNTICMCALGFSIFAAAFTIPKIFLQSLLLFYAFLSMLHTFQAVREATLFLCVCFSLISHFFAKRYFNPAHGFSTLRVQNVFYDVAVWTYV